MLPNSFYFLRHGETDWNKEHRMQGHADIPLNEQGREQARLAIPILQNLPIDRIICSSLARAHETGLIVNAVLQKPLETDDRLRERNYGIFEGKTRQDVEIWKQQNLSPQQLVALTSTIPDTEGVEAYKDFHDRILNAKIEYLKKYFKENILFVAHGGVYRVLLRTLAQDIHESPNAAPYHFMRKAPLQWEINVQIDK